MLVLSWQRYRCLLTISLPLVERILTLLCLNSLTSSKNITSRFCNHFSVLIVITLAKCVLTIQELMWNQRFRDKRTKFKISHHMLASSTQLQNRSFHVVHGKNEDVCKMSQMKKCTCNSVQTSYFSLLNMQVNMQICDVNSCLEVVVVAKLPTSVVVWTRRALDDKTFVFSSLTHWRISV